MKLYTFFICLIAISAFSQNKKDSIINYTDINGNKQGYWEKKYRNEQIAYKAYFIDNMLTGKYIRYYKSGKKMSVINYGDTAGTGYAKIYYDNGVKGAEGRVIKNKIKDGLWKFYGIDGALMSKVNYNNGKKDGLCINYFRNGNKSEEIKYKNDVQNGIWRRFYENGKTVFETNYKNGTRDGIINVFSKNGFLKISGKYKNGLKHGKFIFYDSNGNIKETAEFNRGESDYLDKMNEEFSKAIKEAEKDKNKYAEPNINDMYKSNYRDRYK